MADARAGWVPDIGGVAPAPKLVDERGEVRGPVDDAPVDGGDTFQSGEVARRRICQTVEAAIVMPRTSNSPRMRR
jgi:hypothetical protein